MRRPIRWAALAVLVGGAALVTYWAFNPKERPGWLAARLPTAPQAEVELYRWKDENGQWVISGEPPDDQSIEYEVVRYRHDTNVMPAFEDEN